MSNIIYTDAEQVKLQELTATANQFELYKQLILKANHQGQDAAIVVQAVNFFEEMTNQVALGIQSLKVAASERALNKSKVQDIKEPAKKKGAK